MRSALMHHNLPLEMTRQPDDFTCGPTCLQAIYRYYGDDLPLTSLIEDVPTFTDGGTLAVMLGCDALTRGYEATIYTFNLQVFDPSWFGSSRVDLVERLMGQKAVRQNPKLITACNAYIEFLNRGGSIRMQDLNGTLIRKYLKRSIPILTGLSATYLYSESREIAETSTPDDLRGTPSGHFVVLSGFDGVERTVQVSDPFLPNPLSQGHQYEVPLDRAICSILLGIMTYDANLLIIRPRDPQHHFFQGTEQR